MKKKLVTINLQIDPSIIPDMTGDDPERMGLPSASSGERLANCGASWRMERNQPQLARFMEEAGRGHRIHAVWGGEAERSTLTREELQDLDLADEVAGDLVERWRLEKPALGDAGLLSREGRSWLRVGVVPVSSGRTDRIYQQGNRFLVLDLKTGWGDFPPPRENIQLRIYALHVWSDNPETCDEVSVALIRPIEGQAWHFTYSKNDLVAAAFWYSQVLSSAFRPDAPLIAGGHCTFCRAQLTCPARQRETAAFAGVKEVAAKTWDTCTADDKVRIFLAWNSIKGFGTEVAARIKEELKAGAKLPGLTLGKGRAQREIPDVKAAFVKVESQLSQAEFLGCAKLSYAQLRDTLAAKRGLKKAESDTYAKGLLGALVLESTTDGSVEVA